ncbi:hypothetical protein INT43_000747 [Umbelopsis isabellina]|uniref:K Homology domain-containing protein n=1 Tax=Mortierella isabellina TaxID=91625 RepID=A0A8H7Q4D6_MORIS|nr:hypothetical protein INT43_000747 [Umbelopsis isabellina]
MAQLAYSFCLAVPENGQHRNEEDSFRDLQNACATLSSQTPHITAQFTNDFMVKAQPSSSQQISACNITLTGPAPLVVAAHGELLRDNPTKIKLVIRTSSQDIFTDTSSTKLKPNVQKGLENIEGETSTRISATNMGSKSIISIHGVIEQAEKARVQVLVFLDNLASVKLRTDTLELPHNLHSVVCGKKRCHLHSISKETATNIYLPSVFLSMANNDRTVAAEKPAIIHITGDSVGIARAKDMLTKLSLQKANSMYHKDSILHPRKIDWMMLQRRDELRNIMQDNGSFIALPALGSGSNTITVYAENRVNVERTLRSLNHLACNVYQASFYFKTGHDTSAYSSDDSQNIFNSIENVAKLVTQLAQASGAEVEYKSDLGCIDVFGTERAVRNVYQMLYDMPFLKMYHHETIFNVELANDQREFISGKKNGKINKIMKTCGVKIRFLPFSEYNFVIEVSSTNFAKALDGLTLMQDELPAEISFSVPEVYHRRIIGVGGKNIQRIMKKYGVYVKFSGAEEFASLGGYYNNEDNVVARTPMKNQINLDNLKHAVMELINPRDKDFVTQTLYIPARSHRSVLQQHDHELKEIEQTANAKVHWPDRELSSDKVQVVAPQSQIHLVTQFLNKLVPEEHLITAPDTEELRNLVETTEFKNLVMKIKTDYDFDVTLPSSDEEINVNEGEEETSSNKSKDLDRLSETSRKPVEGSKYLITLKYTQNNIDSLPHALKEITEFLISKNIDPSIQDLTTNDLASCPSDSFDDSLLNFNSESLANIKSPDVGQSSYSLFNHPSGGAFGGGWGGFHQTLESTNTYNEGTSQALPDAPIRAIFEEGKKGVEGDLRMKKPSEVKSQKPSLSTSTSTTSSIWSNAPNPSQSSSFYSAGLETPRSAGYDTTTFGGYIPGNTFGFQPNPQGPTGPSRSSTMHDLRRMSNAPPPSSLTSSYSTGTINNGRLSAQRSLPEPILKRDLGNFQQYQYQQQLQGMPQPPHHGSVRPKVPPLGFQYSKGFGGPEDVPQADNSWEEMNKAFIQPFSLEAMHPRTSLPAQKTNGRTPGFDI